jgi:hypothetical protein
MCEDKGEASRRARTGSSFGTADLVFGILTKTNTAFLLAVHYFREVHAMSEKALTKCLQCAIMQTTG